MSQAAFQGWAGGSCPARTPPSLSHGQCPKGWALTPAPLGALGWTPAAISLPTKHPVAEQFGDIFQAEGAALPRAAQFGAVSRCCHFSCSAHHRPLCPLLSAQTASSEHQRVLENQTGRLTRQLRRLPLKPSTN